MRASRKLTPVSTGQASWPILSRQKRVAGRWSLVDSYWFFLTTGLIHARAIKLLAMFRDIFIDGSNS